MKTFITDSIVAVFFIAICFALPIATKFISDKEYKKGYSDAIKILKPQIDSIQTLLDSSYVLVPRDYKKFVLSKIKK